MIYKTLLLSSYSNREQFVKKTKESFLEVLKLRIRLLGISVEDLEDEEACKRYQIGRDDKQVDDIIIQVARARNIVLLELVWEDHKAVIQYPEVSPDYSLTKLYIQSMYQKPKDEQPQTEL